MHDFKYAVVGNGKWGAQISEILLKQNKEVESLDISRRKKNITKKKYKEYVFKLLEERAGDLDIIWLAVSPGDQDVLIRCALDVGCNVVVEKPLMINYEQTLEIMNYAKSLNLQVAMHYQYCFLENILEIQKKIQESYVDKLTFSAEFLIPRENRLGIPAVYNLGSHLLAIKCFHFPTAKTKYINTGYKSLESRLIKVKSMEKEYILNFLNNSEPIVQRFIESFEAALVSSTIFPINLELELKISFEINELSSIKKNESYS